MGDPLLHIKPMAEGDSVKERFKHHRKAAKSQSNTTHQSINDFIRFIRNRQRFIVRLITKCLIANRSGGLWFNWASFSPTQLSKA